MTEKGYSKKVQPTEGEPSVRIGTIAEGGNPERFLEGEALSTKDSPDNSKSQGDQPSFTMPPFANGTDNRNRG